GACVSMTTVRAAEGLEPTPAAEAAVAVSVSVPSGSVALVQLQLPSDCTGALQSARPVWSWAVTVAPASAVPESTGVGFRLGEASASSDGAAGTYVSTRKRSVAEGALVLPAASAAVAVTACAPSGKAWLRQENEPPVAVAVQRTVVPSRTTTALPAS